MTFSISLLVIASALVATHAFTPTPSLRRLTRSRWSERMMTSSSDISEEMPVRSVNDLMIAAAMSCFEGGSVPEECLEEDCLIVEMCSLEQIEGLGKELLRARTDIVRALEEVNETSSVNYKGKLNEELKSVDEALKKLKLAPGVPFDKKMPYHSAEV